MASGPESLAELIQAKPSQDQRRPEPKFYLFGQEGFSLSAQNVSPAGFSVHMCRLGLTHFASSRGSGWHPPLEQSRKVRLWWRNHTLRQNLQQKIMEAKSAARTRFIVPPLWSEGEHFEHVPITPQWKVTLLLSTRPGFSFNGSHIYEDCVLRSISWKREKKKATNVWLRLW